MGAGNLLKLLSLSIDNILRILNMVVDQLLVGGVDQGHGEEKGGRNERKTPVWDDLNKPVREEGAGADLKTREESAVMFKQYIEGICQDRSLP